ncbi:MAG: serine/threonine protein kinase [Planctomycetaceae bacterium]|nr:serine/threonine protein kinase [Planctomycetaceae bacterium]
MTTPDDIDPVSNDDPWAVVACCVDQFVECFELFPPANIAEFLPESPSETRRLVLTELIKVDMEYRWNSSLPVLLVEDYVDAFPTELSPDNPPLELIIEEYQIRYAVDELLNVDDYLRRFPTFRGELEQALGIDPDGRDSERQAAHPVELEFHSGDELDDFELLQEVGQGGFGTVFLARQKSMQRLVALKIGANREDDEPQTLAQLDHPNVVRVFDQRILPCEGLRLLYMEFVAAGTLRQLIRQLEHDSKQAGSSVLEVVDRQLVGVGQLSPPDSSFRKQLAAADWPTTVALLGIRCASGLEHAHSRGVLHRDIKPANILLAPDASPKIADFNISYAGNVVGASPEAFFGGTLAYMSPEQIRANSPLHSEGPADIDERSDVYSLGVVLWELFTGEHFFGKEQAERDWLRTLEHMLARRKEPRPESFEASTAGRLRRVLIRCLQFDPADRPQTVRELRLELELACHPELAELVEPPQSGWRKWLLQFPRTALFLAAIIPNVFAAVFNFHYNRQEIIGRLEAGNWLADFMLVQGIINAVAFPVGIGIVLWYFESTARALRSSHELSTEEQNRLLRRSLYTGSLASWVSLAAWLIAGVAYPVSLHVIAGQFPLGAAVYFVASLAICGLIAASYPFLLIAVFALRSIQPGICRGRVAALAGIDYRGLARQANVHLVLTALVPLLSITLLALLDTNNRMALGWLSFGGSVGFLLAFLLNQAIQHDVRVLDQIDKDEISKSPTHHR